MDPRLSCWCRRNSPVSEEVDEKLSSGGVGKIAAAVESHIDDSDSDRSEESECECDYRKGKGSLHQNASKEWGLVFLIRGGGREARRRSEGIRRSRKYGDVGSWSSGTSSNRGRKDRRKRVGARDPSGSSREEGSF
ncbi:hypothetical protein MLD38_016227 [Melastoma candidum]|uniref:Uncharacterized protein n=1 Tax=Melastoma candidum TaxID=119954 RepID=A0ACB9RI10_9MYRT|nr:hypothetical protein MLD38_016227 [Melastoma candidum]